MNNEVTIDESRLEAEANAVMVGVEPAVPLAPGEAEAAPLSWAPMIEGITPLLRIAVFPQWQITDPEAKEFADSLGICLDQLFPGGLEGRYACYVRLLTCCGGIVAMRAIQFGKIPPLGPKRAEKAKDGKPAADDQERAAA